MTPNLSFHVRHVLQMAGFSLDEVDDELAELAQVALDRCYYEQLAAQELHRMLRIRRWS